MIRITVLSFLAVGLAAGFAAAQAPVFQADTRVVEVAVMARDSHGSTVTDLRKRDFRLYDNGLEQSIASFDKATVAAQTAGGAASGNSTNTGKTVRRSIVVLDSINGSLAARVSGQKALSTMLGALPPGENSIAIFALGDRLHILHDFSTDLNSLRAAVDSYAGELPGIRAGEPTGFSGGFSLTTAVTAASGGDLYAELRLAHTLDAFREIARNMRNIPGEKNLLWLTAGFLPPEDHQDILVAMRDLAAARVTLYPIDARGLVACIGGACPPEVNLNIASMDELAEATGGKAFHDTNALAESAREAMEDSREGYVLSYAPNNYIPDGSAHAVLLRTSRKGIDLRYRSGYPAD